MKTRPAIRNIEGMVANFIPQMCTARVFTNDWCLGTGFQWTQWCPTGFHTWLCFKEFP